MPTKQIDRLKFAQGGLCFFCEQPLSNGDASVEHLVASSNGGSNTDDNCVVCCKTVNSLLGSMSLKEKIQVVLNQKGQFKCPNGAGSKKATSPPKAKPVATKVAKPTVEAFSLVVNNLTQRGSSRPRTVKKLTSTIKSLFPKGLSDSELNGLINQLKSKGKVKVDGTNVTYHL